MRITDYFMPRSTKELTMKSTPICSPIIQNLWNLLSHPDSQQTLLVNKTTKDSNSNLNSFRLSRSRTLPTGLANVEEKEKEKKKTKHLEAPKNKANLHRRYTHSSLL